MTFALTAIAYHAAVIGAAYKFGTLNAGRGVAIFIVGVAAFQIAVNGPASFFDGGCQEYGTHARDC